MEDIEGCEGEEALAVGWILWIDRGKVRTRQKLADPCSLEELAQLCNSIRRAVDLAFGEIFTLNYSISDSIWSSSYFLQQSRLLVVSF